MRNDKPEPELEIVDWYSAMVPIAEIKVSFPVWKYNVCLWISETYWQAMGFFWKIAHQIIEHNTIFRTKPSLLQKLYNFVVG